MTPQETRFRLGLLLDPDYVGRRLREIRSYEDFLYRARNLGRYGYERLFGAARAAPTGTASVGSVDFLNPRVAARAAALAGSFSAAQPFRHVVVDDFFLPQACRRLSDQFPEYGRILYSGEFRQLGAGRHEKLALLGPAYVELDRFFQSDELSALLSRITGIPDLLPDSDYAGGGTSECREGAESDPHADYTLHPKTGFYRRVKLLLYLNDEWNEAWGGALELHRKPWLGPQLNPIRKIAPLFNRCVILETGDRSWHGFEPVRPPPEKKGLSRREIAAYFYTRGDPRGILPVPPDLAVSVDRPLPAEFKPGHTLTEEDMRLLARRIASRDWKLEYLYGRTIGLFNQWRTVKSELERIRADAPAGAASPATAPSGVPGGRSPSAGASDPRGGS